MIEMTCVCLGEGMVEISGRPGSMTVRYGGDVMNTAVYLSRLGVDCRFATALGRDSYSEAMLAMLADEGVGVSAIARDASRMPGLYIIRTDANGERAFDYWRSDSAARAYFQTGACLDDLEREMEGAGLVYLSGITLSLMTAEAVDAFCERARYWRGRGAEIAFDTNYRPAGWRDADQARRAMAALGAVATIALPTIEDDLLLFGGDGAADSAKRWREWGASVVAVKNGPEGAYISAEAFTGQVRPSEIINPVDTSGAGDSFNAGFLAGLLSGKAPEEAAALGNKVAGDVIRHEGAIAPRTAIFVEPV